MTHGIEVVRKRMNLLLQAQDWLFSIVIVFLFAVSAAVVGMSLLGGPDLLADESREPQSEVAGVVNVATPTLLASALAASATPTEVVASPAAASTPVAVATSTPVPASSLVTRHLVHPGETLTSIATLYNLTVEQVMRADSLGTDSIYAGETLSLPPGGARPRGEARQTLPLQWGK